MLVLKDDEPVFSPRDFIHYIAERRKIPIASLRVPESFLITYKRRVYEQAKQLVDGETVEWWPNRVNPLCIGTFNKVKIGVSYFRIGAPAAVLMLEQAITCGAKVVFEAGLAGGLQPVLQLGDIIVVTEAIRDEGTSSHYLSPETKVESVKWLREGLVQRLKAKKLRHFVGPVWSTDGVYRETYNKLLKFRDANIFAVDMETSAIFAVSQFRNVVAASALIISDILTEKRWIPAFDDESVRENMATLLQEVLTVLSGK